jgi:hypothetical protein
MERLKNMMKHVYYGNINPGDFLFTRSGCKFIIANELDHQYRRIMFLEDGECKVQFGYVKDIFVCLDVITEPEKE